MSYPQKSFASGSSPQMIKPQAEIDQSDPAFIGATLNVEAKEGKLCWNVDKYHTWGRGPGPKSGSGHFCGPEIKNYSPDTHNQKYLLKITVNKAELTLYRGTQQLFQGDYYGPQTGLTGNWNGDWRQSAVFPGC